MADVSQGSARTAAAERVVWTRFPAAAVAAVAVSVVACVLLFAVESALGIIDHSVSVPSMIGNGPVSAASVTVAAAGFSIGAVIVFAVIGLIGRRPILVFRIVSVVALLLSLTLPLTVAGPSPGMRAGLVLMHVSAWAVDVGILTTVAGRSS